MSYVSTCENLAPFSLSNQKEFVRLYPEDPSSLRDPLQRDRDRIIHAAAFRKLGYKTQVFMCFEGDYYRTRLSHSLEVAQVARTLARHFRVNEDLVETIALSHDLGHTPFGHAGEDVLNEMMQPYGGFDHNAQALRIVTFLEKRYPDFSGLNLTWDVLEGLVKHNGPLLKVGESIDALPYALNVYAQQQDLAWHQYASFEAQLVALADDIAYNTHDIEDGLRAGFFTLEDLVDLPILGRFVQEGMARGCNTSSYASKGWDCIYNVLRQFMGFMIQDLINVTRLNIERMNPTSPEDVRMACEPIVSWSLGEARKAWRSFFFKHMYRHPKVLTVMIKAKRVMTDLFSLFCEYPSLILDENTCSRLTKTEIARFVCDHIASMTDRSILAAHGRYFDITRL